MYPVSVTRQRIEQLLSAIESGSDIPAPVGGWSVLDMTAVAGCLYFATASHGPPHIPAEHLAKMSDEYREASSEVLMQDILDAISFVSHYAMQVADDQIDERARDQIVAVVFRDADGNQKAQFFDQ